MSILQSGATKSLAASYEIDNSLRFNIADSASLERTQVSGNRTTWTFSAWVKRGDITSAQNEYFLSTNGSDDNTFLGFYFKGASGTSPDQLTITGNTNAFLRSTQVFRDPSAWYHIVVQANTTSGTAAERLRVWVNGGEITSWAADYRSSMSSMNLGMNESGRVLALGWETLSDAYEFGGYLAEVYLIDGTAYDADDFGELDSDTNQWIPLDSDDVKDAVTFGTNGFYQKYGSSGGHTSFLADGTYTVPAGVTSVDYLVVGGGGGGGGFGGGGGAGGYRTGTLSVTAGADYSITVGDGGTGGVFGAGTPQGVGTAGGDSVFSTITSTGGGQGGAPGNRTGYAGGSGGGGSDGYAGGAGGSYGNNGGSSGTNVGAGGGGASNVGYNGTANTTGGAGGGGTASSITGASVTYAGGGGGGTTATTSGWGGAGGAGGGGAGNATQYGDASHGTANTGGGGGGGGYSDGGNGGSGIVIIKPAAGFGLGLDSSGEGNNFTATNLVATDQMIDTPTNNFCTANPLFPGRSTDDVTYTEGNLKLTWSGSNNTTAAVGTIQVEGKVYFETLCKSQGSAGNDAMGLARSDKQDGDLTAPWKATTFMYGADAEYHNGTTQTTADSSYTTGDIISCAYDADTGKIWFAKNGTWLDSGDPAAGTDENFTIAAADRGLLVPAFIGYKGNGDTVWILNAGSDSSFAAEKTAQGNQDGNGKGDFYYEPPTDFLALCTSNLSDPEIALPGEYFNSVLYTGDDSTDRSITGVGFQPDFVAIKARSVGDSHADFDSVRGRGVLHFNATNIENTTTGPLMFDSYDSDGFTISYDVSADLTNRNSQTYVAWNWLAGGAPTADNSAGAGATPTAGSVKIDGSNLGSALAGTIAATRLSANTTSGFSIVEWTGTGTASTVAHGLSTAPTVVIVKNTGGPTSAANEWAVYSEPVGNTKALLLDDTSAPLTSPNFWNDATPTASVFSVYQSTTTNDSGEFYIAYCFSNIEGYSKVGSYTGNASADGAFVYTGFRPAFLLAKNVASGKPWVMYDDKRDTYNEMYKQLVANDNAAADTSEGRLDFVSNGIKWIIGDSYHNDGSFIYIAFASNPFKTSNAR